MSYAERMPNLSPVPAPLAQLADWHRAACRAAARHGLDMSDPGDQVRIAAFLGWDLGPAKPGDNPPAHEEQPE